MPRPLPAKGPKNPEKDRPLAVWAQSLGCPKNRVDSERLLGSLGLPVKPVAHMGRSRLVFINTCGFIEPAVRESIRAILHCASHLSTLRRRPLLAVAGCMVGRYGVDELARELPEVDLWLPTEAQERWPDMIRAALGYAPATNPVSLRRLLSTGPCYAWLKVSEGCRHRCAFCTIPAIRGPLRSTPQEALVAEARTLLAQGVRELNLVAQDLTAWGSDLKGPNGAPCLENLLEALAMLPGLHWLRLLYLYPSGVSESLLRRMAEIGPPVLPYLDIPFQHISAGLLKSMGRPFAHDPRRVLERVRKHLPGAVLRTTMIVGYPGESEADFAELCRFVEEARFNHLGVFAYQAEEGTRAARLENQVPMNIREERRQRLMEIQQGISAEILRESVAKRLPVLVEEPVDDWPGLHRGRVWFQAPEVDGSTFVSGPGVAPGKMVECDIEDSSDYDLSALA